MRFSQICLILGAGLFLGITVHAAVPLTSDANPTSSQSALAYRPGRVLVKLKPEVVSMGDTDREAALQKAESVTGVRNRRAFSHLPGQQLLEFDQSKSVPDMVQKLSETGLYEFVEADHIRRARLDPNEANYTSGLLWSLHNTGNNGTAGGQIRAPARSAVF